MKENANETGMKQKSVDIIRMNLDNINEIERGNIFC